MNISFIEPYATDNYYFTGTYCFSISERDYSFLLDNNTGNSIILDKKYVKEINNKKISAPLLNKLFSHNLVKKEHFSSRNYCSPKEKSCITNFFIIDISGMCNLSCIYCFRDSFKNVIIDNNTLKDICLFIDKVATDYELKNIWIQLWGGEPLFALDAIEQVCLFFRGKKYHTTVALETNGTLITEEVAEMLYNYNIQVGVSIDGLPNVQDFQRPFVNGTNSTEAVLKGITNLKKFYGSKIGGICVVTKKNHHLLNEMISYIVNTVELSGVKFNLIKENKNERIHRLGLSESEIEEFTYNLFMSIESYQKKGVNLNEGNITTVFKNLRERDEGSICLSMGCQGGKKMISFDRNGDIFPCDLTEFSDLKIGSIYDEESLLEMLYKSEKYNPFFHKIKNNECVKCPWNYFCKGGCTGRCFYEGDISLDNVQCTINKTIYPLAIDRILKGSALF